MKEFTLSVVAPAYNEERNIQEFLETATDALEKYTKDYELLLIDDGSKDKTLELAKEFAKKNSKVKVIQNERNLGFGATERKGLEMASMELVTLIPSDNQFYLPDLSRYLEEIKNSDIVLGFRIKRQDPLMRRVSAKMYSLAIAILFNATWFGDIDWVKMYKREIFQKIKITSTTAFVDAEILIKADKLKYKVTEIGVNHIARKHGKATGGNLKVIYRQLSDVFLYWWKYIKKKELFSRSGSICW